MNTWKVILATLVIFVTGLVTGGLLTRFIGQGEPAPAEPAHPERGPAPAHPQPPPGPAGLVRIDFLKRMQRELDLKPDQRQRIDKILKESQERTKKLMEPIAPDLHAEVQRTKDAFREALTPEQRARFDELLKQQQKPKDSKKPQPPREKNPAADLLATNAVPAPAP